MIYKKLDHNIASFFICGDIVNKEISDGHLCSTELSAIISSADYSVCNFEAPIEGYGKPAQKPGIHLCQKAETINILKKQGFDLLLLANNHIMDYGESALAAVIKKASDCKLDTLGAGLDTKSAYQPLIKTIKDIKFGMVNACESQYGVIDSEEKEERAGYAWVNDHTIDLNIIKLKQICDYVIVFSHAGLENYPIPQKEWRIRYKHFCDLGADIVIGSHPHVPQGFEKYGKSLIFYSLGNFYFDFKGLKEKKNNSFAVWLEFKKGEQIKFELIYHFTESNKVQLATKNKVDIEELNDLLAINYDKEHYRMTMQTFNKLKRNLAISTILPVPLSGNLYDLLRMFGSSILRYKSINYKDLYQLHLLKNESYYFVIVNALELKNRIY